MPGESQALVPGRCETPETAAIRNEWTDHFCGPLNSSANPCARDAGASESGRSPYLFASSSQSACIRFSLAALAADTSVDSEGSAAVLNSTHRSVSKLVPGL